MSLKVIPNQIDLNKSEQYVLDKIKRLYSGVDREATLYLEPKIRNLNPDFILIDKMFGIAIIEVKAWSYDYITNLNQKEVKTSDGRTYGNPTYKARKYYNTLKSIFSFNESLLNDEAEFKYNLVSNIFFTELDESLEFAEFFNHYPARTFYKKELRTTSIEEIFNNEVSEISQKDFISIRSLIFPEIKISAEKVENKTFDVDNFSVKALDTNQEAFIKRDINGHYIVSGTPGSGKTVMLVSRAIYLLKKNPEWNIGIITYNKSLATKIENRLDSLQEDLKFMEINISNIEVRTFHNLALYFSGMRVPKNADGEFWQELLPNEALKKVSPLYDSILVDEYQDFYKSWIELCIKATRTVEKKKSIFFAGDRLQSIYNPKEANWKQDFDLDMSGRSMLLKKSYRTSKAHISTALEILKADPVLKKEVENFYDGFDGIETFNKVKESLQLVQGYYSNVISEIEKLISSEKYKASDFLVLVPNWKIANKIKSYFSEEIQNDIITSKDIVSDKMVITTYYSSKGLENHVAVVFNFDGITDRKLAYVSITRASEKLFIHYSNSDSPIISDILNINSN
jgi:superfamily I DNA and RNA helicase